MPALIAGKAAPDFLLPSTTGERVRLQTLLKRGPVLAAFFKISCPICHYAFPFVERIYQAFRHTGVTVLGISQNGKADTLRFMREFDIHFPVLLDDPRKYEVSNAYGLTNVPTFFLISPQGKIELSSVSWVRAELDEINARAAKAAGQPVPQIFHKGEEVADWRPG